MSGLLAALCVTITEDDFIPNAVGSQVTPRSISADGSTESAMVTTNSALLLVTLVTTKEPPPTLEPIVSCVLTESPICIGVILNELASKSTVGCGGIGLTSMSSKYA